MNNKGFTLVELLAVIAIICNTIWCWTICYKYIVKQRKKTYQNFEGQLKDCCVTIIFLIELI